MRLCSSTFVEPAKAVDVSRKLRKTLAMAFFISMSFPFRRHDAEVLENRSEVFEPEEYRTLPKGSSPRLKPNKRGQRRNLFEQPTASAVKRALSVAEIRGWRDGFIAVASRQKKNSRQNLAAGAATLGLRSQKDRAESPLSRCAGQVLTLDSGAGGREREGWR
jgi:hypothetical protein